MPIDNILQYFASILIALTIHEAAHAISAYWLGDNTAKNAGRVTLNPIKHLDLWGSLLFIFVGIGWGKPVPVNPNYFKNPKRDQALVALAGPLSNFLLAGITVILLKFIDFTNLSTFQAFLNTLLNINVVLCALNLLPIPPLDGSKILAIFIPQKHYYKYTDFLEANLTYIVAFFLADMFLFQDIFGFSILNTILSVMTGLIKTILYMGL